MNELSIRFVEIGYKLEALHRELYDLEKDQTVIGQQIERRKVALIPEGGWQGSNDIARKAHRDTTWAADTALEGRLAEFDLRAEDISALRLDMTCFGIEQKSLELALAAHAMRWPVDGLGTIYRYLEEQALIAAGDSDDGPESELDLR